MSSPSPEALARAKTQAKSLLLDIDGVQGVGIGDGTVRIYVRDDLVVGELPADIDGVPVEPVTVGEVTAEE